MHDGKQAWNRSPAEDTKPRAVLVSEARNPTFRHTSQHVLQIGVSASPSRFAFSRSENHVRPVRSVCHVSQTFAPQHGSNNRHRLLRGALFAAPSLARAQEKSPLQFKEVTAEVGLAKPLHDWKIAHAGAWGDVNGDGRPDLYLGAFADRRKVFGGDDAPPPNMLFLSHRRRLQAVAGEVGALRG